LGCSSRSCAGPENSPFLFAANSSSLRRRWRSKRGDQRTVKKEQKTETPRAPIFYHASRRLSSTCEGDGNTVSSHKQEQQQHQKGGKAVAATPPTAPAAAQTRRKGSRSNTREEEEQPQQHHQPHQLIISFGLCFHFLAYKTCRNREEEVQETRRKREDRRL